MHGLGDSGMYELILQKGHYWMIDRSADSPAGPAPVISGRECGQAGAAPAALVIAGVAGSVVAAPSVVLAGGRQLMSNSLPSGSLSATA